MAEAIDYFSSRHPLRQLASRVSLRARRTMFQTFWDTMKPGPGMRVLDVGVTPDRSLPESNFFEALYPHPEHLTATSIEDASFLEAQYPGLTFRQTAPGPLPFEDGSFDIAVSFAVLEHVGDREAQRAFIAELNRVAKRVFLTTPDRAFPIEMHTFLPALHWLPQPLHQRALRTLGMDFWAETANLNLLDRETLRALFPQPEAVKLQSHRLLGWSSNLIAST
ncbi:MAG: class I SAM-dependent methyltransferase [Candidatus Sericytochromatia bacterium]